MKTFAQILFLLLSTSLFAQTGEKIRDKIRAQRIAFITSKLQLTPAEAEKFWPVYNQFTAEFEVIKKDMNKLRKSTNENLLSMSDKDIEIALEKDIENQQKLTDLHRKYQKELKTAISARKIAILYKTEHDFKLQLLKRMRDKGHQPSPDDDF